MSKAMKLAAVVALISGLVVGVNATPAAANSGCGSICDGQDPESFTMDYNGNVITCALDAVTKKTAQVPQIGGQTVDLRFSNRCQTA